MNMRSYPCCELDAGNKNNIEKISGLLKIAGDTSRLKILCILRKKEHCVCKLMEHLDMSQSLISHHLQDLKDAGLVADEKRGQYVFYSLTDEGRRITDLLFQI